VLYDIKNAVLDAGGLTVGVAGDGSSCPLIGSTNVQGRFTNGSTDPCLIPATGNSGYFIHVEQHREVREDPGEYAKLIHAVNQAIGSVTAVVDLQLPRPAFALAPPWPNPGRAVTVQLSLMSEQEVTIEVFDLSGRRRVVWFLGVLRPGTYPLRLNNPSLSAGKYWISAHGGGTRVSRPWMKIP
jgi:hypothetical protein